MHTKKSLKPNFNKEIELKVTLAKVFFVVVLQNIFLQLPYFYPTLSARINRLLKFGFYRSNIDSINPWLNIDYCSVGQALSVKRFFNSAGYSIKYSQDKTMFSITEPTSMISQWMIYYSLALHA